ncbi:tRNA (adenosine(37)-N6)-threonylcarbamoyltransferase complex dimerization subunit type 1 TsaB [uncultured Tyzzerella sp.]|uniref:tRNA (adenosine(37)-N6)-threonylcarbamoyltransferase complex dimerization subunit type 1 TsaB n=1 Tax=uncultured Tyzzerella sp. TaxID=2321398 RepID=UPI002943D837|nr:tRNA (adenosine(37)-N6)-threonylcarbamoyltransferase complex dimerization subunit type 1 TsaB [uncultured Tyzzerella sp.]
MNILAIDTSGVVASVAIANNEKILGEINLNYKQNHSVTIMPIIDNLLKMLEMDISDIDYFALSKGPGSFTGLRIGAATIKAMAHILNKKIIPISTLDAMAYNIMDSNRYIVPIIDAKAERIFAGIYTNENGMLVPILEECATTIRELLEYILSNDIEPIFLGDGAISYKNIIKEHFKEENFAPISLNMQRASSLASLAFLYEKQQKYVDYNNLEIEYLRKPQAERELEERKNS